jgi:hypothetical protein
MRFVTDNVEALIELGRLEDASSLLDWFEERALALDRRSALASAARCRGLLAAAAGDAGGALELLTAAAGRHANTCVPFESARTLLALGSHSFAYGASERRANRSTMRWRRSSDSVPPCGPSGPPPSWRESVAALRAAMA